MGYCYNSMFSTPYFNSYQYEYPTYANLFSQMPVVPSLSVFDNNIFGFTPTDGYYGANPFSQQYMSPINLTNPFMTYNSTPKTIVTSNVFGFLRNSSSSTSQTSSSQSYSNIFGFLKTTPTTTISTQTVPIIKARKVNLNPEFINGVKQIAQEINCDYKDLLAVMNSESGLNPQAYNPNSGASGLIQFMPATARSYGVTTQQIRNMSAIEQLPYIKRYLLDAKKMAGFATSDKLSAGDLYSLVFLPGRAKRDVLCSGNERYHTCNTGLDKDHDGKITKQDLAQQVYSKRVALA